jgi:Tol biopolymer transport system component
LAATGFQETAPAVSPDGRWLAYVSNETGGPEVYVRPFPNVDDGRWLVSTNGGTEPVWAHSGRELFYRNGQRDLVAVAVLPGEAFTTGEQRTLFSTQPYRADVYHRMYDITPDDQRFVMIRVQAEGGQDEVQLIVVENFFEELKAKVGS